MELLGIFPHFTGFARFGFLLTSITAIAFITGIVRSRCPPRRIPPSPTLRGGTGSVPNVSLPPRGAAYPSPLRRGGGYLLRSVGRTTIPATCATPTFAPPSVGGAGRATLQRYLPNIPIPPRFPGTATGDLWWALVGHGFGVWEPPWGQPPQPNIQPATPTCLTPISLRSRTPASLPHLPHPPTAPLGCPQPAPLFNSPGHPFGHSCLCRACIAWPHPHHPRFHLHPLPRACAAAATTTLPASARPALSRIALLTWQGLGFPHSPRLPLVYPHLPTTTPFPHPFFYTFPPFYLQPQLGQGDTTLDGMIGPDGLLHSVGTFERH